MENKGLQTHKTARKMLCKLWQKASLFDVIKPLNLRLLILFMTLVSSVSYAEQYDASGDYILDCEYATCVGLAAMRWSKQNPFGVAIGVRMGTKPAVTDDQIKMVLTRDLNHYGITNIKFFYEQNDAIASGITLHVRGGTEGVFMISNVRQEIELIAERAKNSHPVTLPID